MTYRLFEGKDHAMAYWKYRISPSDDLLQQVLGFLEKHKGQPWELAVDVGCGSGQGTLLLAKHFASVVGTDVSPAQLEVALLHSKELNVSYRQCVAEELPFADCSVDLVTAMSAFHWFDRARFLQEAHRVLKPRGCLALLNYTIDMELSFPNCNLQELNQICKEFYAALQPYRSPHLGQSSIQLYREAYESIPYPDKEWQEYVWDRKHMPLSNFMGLVESFSSYQALLKDYPQRASSLSQVTCQSLSPASSYYPRDHRLNRWLLILRNDAETRLALGFQPFALIDLFLKYVLCQYHTPSVSAASSSSPGRFMSHI